MAKDKEQKKTFVIYEDMMNIVLSLPDDAALDFARTLFSYYLQKDFDASAVSAGLLETFKARIDADIAEYKAKCQKNKDNIAAYWERKRNTNEYERIQSNTNVSQSNTSRIYDNDNDNVYDNGNDNDNDIVFSTKRKKKMSSDEDMKEIVDIWNDTFANTDVPKVTILKSGSKRAKMLQARLDEFGQEKIKDAISIAAASSFLTSSSWFSFDWFVCPSNFVKIIEGNYADHAKKPAPQSKEADKLQDFYDMAAKWAEGG